MKGAFLTAVALAALAACGGGDGEARWNLVVVSLDTTRADRLGCYGNPRDVTPEIDAFAAEAARFADCRAASTLTGPSHRSLFTSHHVTRHGILKNGHPSRSPYTLAGLLRAAGWRTAGFVGGGPMTGKFGLSQGFDRWVESSAITEAHEGHLERSLGPGLEWIDAQDGKPFFLFLHGFDPHCPYTPPAEVRGLWSGAYAGTLDPSGRCGQEGFGELQASGAVGTEEIGFLRDLYDEELHSADAAFGRLLAGLRERGLLERTVVVFVSDHGESLGEHAWIGHGRSSELELRVPLIVRFPGGAWSGVRKDPVMGVDLAPTLLAALGVAAPPGMQGRDLMPSVRGETELPADRIRFSRTGNHFAFLFDGRWKLVYLQERERRMYRELYDLHEDPGETRNLFLEGGEEGRGRTSELLDRARAWLASQAAEDSAFAATILAVKIDEADRAGLAVLGYADDEIAGGQESGQEQDGDR
ncbi:MAG TPA: sulfatase [Planctomycetota bacterium]